MKRESVLGVTIDDQHTRDIDDAIWVKSNGTGYTATVSIADVAKVVPPGSNLHRLAQDRLATKYFASGTNFPMLPRTLADWEISLWPNKLKRTITVEVSLDENLTPTNVRLFRSTLVSKQKLAYDQIPGILADKNDPLHSVTALAHKLAFGLLTKRRNNGAMVLYDLNNGWVMAEDGHIRPLKNKNDAVGYIIIQELMILANQAVSVYAQEKGIPILFRNHEGTQTPTDREALLAQIRDAEHTPLYNLDFLRKKTHLLLEKARYGGTVKGHFGLNIPSYTHFTSPIRRFADLVVHQQIRAYLKGTPLPYTQEELEVLGESITQRLDERATRRNDAEKTRAEQRATIAIERRKLDALTPKEFERATKVQTRSGEEAHDHFIEAFEAKLTEGTLPLICAAFVFFTPPETEGWMRLRAGILQWITKSPELAISLVTMAQQTHEWPSVEFEVVSGGQDHSKTFKARALLLREPLIKGPWCQGPNIKLAKQYATVGLLAQLFGLDPPEFQSPREAAKVEPLNKWTLFLEGKHPVSVLGEWCQAQKWEMPVYQFTGTGPFKCTVIVNDLQRTGEGTSKADAKLLAATAVVGALTKKDGVRLVPGV